MDEAAMKEEVRKHIMKDILGKVPGDNKVSAEYLKVLADNPITLNLVAHQRAVHLLQVLMVRRMMRRTMVTR